MDYQGYEVDASNSGCCYKNGNVIVSVTGAPSETFASACCSIETYGKNPTAFWNYSYNSAECCDGQAMCGELNGKKICSCCKNECIGCNNDGTCPAGQEKVVNHIDGIGACGYVCCEKKADKNQQWVIPAEEHIFNCTCTNYENYEDYQIAGAVNGVCCGYYGNYAAAKSDCDYYTEYIRSFSIKENNGVYYCAEEGSHKNGCCWGCDGGDMSVDDYDTYTYLSSSKYRHKSTDSMDKTTTKCYCSDSGDPKIGNECAC